MIAPASNPNLAAAKLIDPQALMSIRNLELRARAVVEGFWSGLHRSPYHGFSVEFADHREYVPGDDLRTGAHTETVLEIGPFRSIQFDNHDSVRIPATGNKPTNQGRAHVPAPDEHKFIGVSCHATRLTASLSREPRRFVTVRNDWRSRCG